MSNLNNNSNAKLDHEPSGVKKSEAIMRRLIYQATSSVCGNGSIMNPLWYPFINRDNTIFLIREKISQINTEHADYNLQSADLEMIKDMSIYGAMERFSYSLRMLREGIYPKFIRQFP